MVGPDSASLQDAEEGGRLQCSHKAELQVRGIRKGRCGRRGHRHLPCRVPSATVCRVIFRGRARRILLGRSIPPFRGFRTNRAWEWKYPLSTTGPANKSSPVPGPLDPPQLQLPRWPVVVATLPGPGSGGAYYVDGRSGNTPVTDPKKGGAKGGGSTVRLDPGRDSNRRMAANCSPGQCSHRAPRRLSPRPRATDRAPAAPIRRVPAIPRWIRLVI